MAQSVIEMTSQSGRSYIVEEVLQQRETPPRYVYLANEQTLRHVFFWGCVHKRIIFAVSEEELGDGEKIVAHVLERQISYFADEEGLDALYKHIGDDHPWVQVFDILRGGFSKENPRRPVSLWKDVDPELRNLVGGLTNFNPAKRLTAREALEHPWFKDV
ncbi:hypothetical protein F4782DRAFT_533699 [Xylaria castorea]|nr:hypothetical protein F4782DRAFT_533699 [Xylaria castorea]